MRVGGQGLGFEADELARHGVVEDLGVREDLARLPARHLRGGGVGVGLWGGGREPQGRLAPLLPMPTPLLLQLTRRKPVAIKDSAQMKK